MEVAVSESCSHSLPDSAPSESPQLACRNGAAGFLEVPEHMRRVVSAASLTTSDSNSERDDLNRSCWSSAEPERADLPLIDQCIEDIALAPIHIQEMLTEDFGQTSPSHSLSDAELTATASKEERQDLKTPTSPKASLSEKRGRVEKYLLWGRLSSPFLVFTVVGVALVIVARSHLMQLLTLLQNLPWIESCIVFIFLFTLISFPFGIGYVILNMMAGYLYGFFRGQIVVMISVSFGFSVSFLLCRLWFREYARQTVTSSALQAIMRVVEGKHGVKVIILTRQTPIPFGLQNVVLSVSIIL